MGIRMDFFEVDETSNKSDLSLVTTLKNYISNE